MKHVSRDLNDRGFAKLRFDFASKDVKLPVFIGIMLVAFVVGGGVGYAFAPKGGAYSAGGPDAIGQAKTGATYEKGDVVGEIPESMKELCSDKAEGILREGGFEGEGTFHLERPGGKSQYVYLTSSSVPLQDFIGKKVRVIGQTFEPQKVGWLMDVCQVEIL